MFWYNAAQTGTPMKSLPVFERSRAIYENGTLCLGICFWQHVKDKPVDKFMQTSSNMNINAAIKEKKSYPCTNFEQLQCLLGSSDRAKAVIIKPDIVFIAESSNYPLTHTHNTHLL